MPWLAPFGTPACEPTIDIQAPIWHSSRASRSSGSDLTPARPRPSSFNACAEAASDIGWHSGEQMSSTAWSTARMPVDRNSHSGVCIVARGSSSTLCGIISGSAKLSFTLRAVSVQPADAVYSPADNVVGIATVRTASAWPRAG